MLTDTAGLFTADPKHVDDASLIEEIVEVDAALEQLAGGAGTARGSGGMASKLQAAKIAAWSGVRAVIAAATADNVVVDALDGKSVGTAFAPRPQRLSSRKLWIAFAQGARGSHRRRRRCAQRARQRGPLAARRRRTRGRRQLRRRRRGRDRRRARRPCSPRASAATPRPNSVPSPGVAPPTSPTAFPHEVVHRDDLVVLP